MIPVRLAAAALVVFGTVLVMQQLPTGTSRSRPDGTPSTTPRTTMRYGDEGAPRNNPQNQAAGTLGGNNQGMGGGSGADSPATDTMPGNPANPYGSGGRPLRFGPGSGH